MIFEIILFLTFAYFIMISYKNHGIKGIMAVLLTYGIIYLMSITSESIISYILLCVVMYFYYSNENIEDFFLKSLVLFSTLFLVGYWRMTDKEGMSTTARGGTKYMGKKTVLECQNSCESNKKCKYTQTPAGSSKKYDKVDCYIDILGTGQDPIKTGRFDIWKNKLFKRPNPCDEKKKTSRGRDRKKGSDYRGCINWTKRGMPCQKWTSQRPHRHNRYPTNRIYKNKGLGNHNYCRNPDGEPGGIWCYTTLSKKRWDYC